MRYGTVITTRVFPLSTVITWENIDTFHLMIPFLLNTVDGLLNENLAHFLCCPWSFYIYVARNVPIKVSGGTFLVLLYVPWNFSHRPFCGCQHANVVKSSMARKKLGGVVWLRPPFWRHATATPWRVASETVWESWWRRDSLSSLRSSPLIWSIFLFYVWDQTMQLCFCSQLISDAMMQNARRSKLTPNDWYKESHQCAIRHRAVMRQFIVHGDHSER